MAWLDDQGIAHDGEPPTDHCVLGGRWYPVDETLSNDGQSSEREFVAVC